MEKNILACGTHAGSVNAIKPVIVELVRRGHEVNAYATGNESQAKSFGAIPYEHVNLSQEGCDNLLDKKYNLLLVGPSGTNTPEYFFLKTASRNQIPSVAVMDLDIGYGERFGDNPDYFPTILSVMNPQCKDTIRKELSNEVADELIKRTRVTGWTIFDHLASLKENFSENDKINLLTKLGLNFDENYPLHFTQVIHPDTKYMKPVERPYTEKQKEFDYELRTTGKIFEIVSDLGLKLLVKPHPGEEFETNFTLDLVKKHGFNYIPAKACDTKQLILSADSVSGGRTTCIVESCLLDKNTGGIFPELSPKDVAWFPSVTTGAIPYTFEWEKVEGILKSINSSDAETNKVLQEQRKRFSVDGKASKRLVDIIEEEIF